MQGEKLTSQFLQFGLAVVLVFQIIDKDTTKVIHIFQLKSFCIQSGHSRKESYFLDGI